jgi:hypothetical protein
MKKRRAPGSIRMKDHARPEPAITTTTVGGRPPYAISAGREPPCRSRMILRLGGSLGLRAPPGPEPHRGSPRKLLTVGANRPTFTASTAWRSGIDVLCRSIDCPKATRGGRDGLPDPALDCSHLSSRHASAVEPFPSDCRRESVRGRERPRERFPGVVNGEGRGKRISPLGHSLSRRSTNVPGLSH